MCATGDIGFQNLLGKNQLGICRIALHSKHVHQIRIYRAIDEGSRFSMEEIAIGSLKTSGEVSNKVLDNTVYFFTGVAADTVSAGVLAKASCLRISRFSG